tara:strand:+ start:344 stop:1282 length:939 start_codon:yes stop_codon:yes gene_type:complete
MKREAELALESLRNQNTELGKGGTDSTPDITVPTSYEQRDVVQNDDGSWGETITEEESPIKKDIEQRASELAGHETDVTNYENLAKIGDNKILSILNEINVKKQEILTTVDTAVSAGCTYFLGDGTKTSLVNSGPVTVGGVVLGPANTQTEYNTSYPVISKDVIKLYKYDDLTNYSSDAPFSGISSSAITGTNVGAGYSNQCFLNYGATIEAGGSSQFKIIKGTEGGACAGYLNTINTLASEIGTLRDSLATDWDDAATYVGIFNDTNEVKDKKTDSELFVWAYKNSDEKIQEKQISNNSLIDTIENQSEFQ